MTDAPPDCPLILTSPEDTARLAAWIAPQLQAGDVLLLDGPIGAGKSHFARTAIQTLMQRHGTVEDVPSPTFTLVQTYELGDVAIWHADLYRLATIDEIVELGLEEAFETAICLIEWPDRLGEIAPRTALRMRFALLDDPGARMLTLTGPAPRWSALLEAIRSGAWNND